MFTSNLVYIVVWNQPGNLNYSEKTNRPDISYGVYQCEKISKDTRKPHGEVFKRIGRYLKGTDKMGIYIHPRDSDVKVWSDTYFNII